MPLEYIAYQYAKELHIPYSVALCEPFEVFSLFLEISRLEEQAKEHMKLKAETKEGKL